MIFLGNICFWCILCSIGFVLLLSLFFPTANVFFHFSILKNYRKIKFESDYYRDILGYSPSEILYIYNKEYKNNKLSRYEKICKYQKLFYINILKMYLLGMLELIFLMKII